MTLTLAMFKGMPFYTRTSVFSSGPLDLQSADNGSGNKKPKKGERNKDGRRMARVRGKRGIVQNCVVTPKKAISSG